MPKIRRARGKPPPDGWELIEPTLEELEGKMREAESESHEGKRKTESLWPIFKVSVMMQWLTRKFSLQVSISDSSSAIAIHLRHVLQAQSDIARTVRLLHQVS